MIPYIEIPPFKIGPLVIQPFGFLVCVAIILGGFLFHWRARQVGLAREHVRNIFRICAFLGVFGSHVIHLVVYHPQTLARDPWSLLRFWDGMSSLGGFFSAFLFVSLYVRWKKIDFLPYADAAVYAFVPLWMVARMGCAVVHDHPGRLTRFPLAVRFPDGPRHDLGLYEVFLSLLWIPLVLWLGRKKQIDDPPRGTILSVMSIAYAVPRFFLDFLRATDLPGHDVRYFGFTFAQYGCLLMIAAGGWFLWKQRRSAGVPDPA